jgi:arabinofuranosyltransferase
MGDDLHLAPRPVAGAIEGRLQRLWSSRLITIAAAALPFALLGTLTFANTPDDALITLRYASNLLLHGQPVFNLGERVEGYTSPLHLVLATVVLLLPGGLALLKLKLASLAFAAGALWQTNRLSRAAGLPRWAVLATLVAVAGSWDFMLSASNGLETSLVAFLATGAAASLTTQGSVRRWWRPAIWTGVLALSRPDALLIVVALAGASLAYNSAYPWWRRIRWLAGPAITLGVLLAFRAVYYGDLVPNTYFAKHLGLGAAAALGSEYLTNSVPLAGWGIGILVLALQSGLIWVGVRRFIRTRAAVGYALAVVLAQVVFILGSGGDWMKGGRFLAPAIPVTAVLLLSGVVAVLAPERTGRAMSRARRGLTVTAVLAVLVAPVAGTYLAPAWELTNGVSDSALIAAGNYPFSNMWAAAGGIADCLKPGQSVAYSEIGLFGYQHLTLRVVDTSGITTPEIAKQAPAADKHPWGVTDPQWFRPSSTIGRVLAHRRPELIIDFEEAVTAGPGGSILAGLYRRAAIIPEPHSKTLLVYLRRNFSCPVALNRIPRAT